jgi:hypothetical protein
VFSAKLFVINETVGGGRAVLAFLVRTGPIPEPDMSGFEGSVSVHILDLKNIVRQETLIIGKAPAVRPNARYPLAWALCVPMNQKRDMDTLHRQFCSVFVGFLRDSYFGLLVTCLFSSAKFWRKG